MSEIKINAEIDIYIDEESINLYQKRNNTSISDPEVLREIALLGSCSVSESIDCTSVIANLLEVNEAESDTLKKFLQGDQADTCKIIQSLETKSIDYYLVYVFDKSPGSVESVGNSNEINGSIEITPFEPKSSSDQYGGKDPSKALFCDLCAQIFRNKLSYSLADGGDSQLESIRPNSGLQVDYDWRANGFNDSIPIKDINEDNISITKTRSFTSPYGKQQTETYKVLALDRYIIHKTEYGTVAINAKYNGFNKWLYTKYYGGNAYDVITTRKKETRVGISLGKIFTLTVDVGLDPLAPRNRSDQKNIISIIATPSGEMKFFGKDTAKEFLKLTKNETKEKLPDLIDFRTFETLQNLYSSGIIDFEKDESGKFKLYPDTEKEIKEAKIFCCETYPEANFDIKVKKLEKGIVSNKIITIDKLQKAQGGIYNNDITLPKNPCCEKCYYCIFGSLCDGLGDILQSIRDQELQMRDHLAKPYTTTDGFRTAKNPGPQCVAYDYGSGWPVPIQDIKGF